MDAIQFAYSLGKSIERDFTDSWQASTSPSMKYMLGISSLWFKSWLFYIIFCGHANYNINILTYFDKLSTN